MYDQKMEAGAAQVCCEQATQARPMSDAEQKAKAAYAEADAKTRDAYKAEADKEMAQHAARPIVDRLTRDIDGLSEQLERSLRARNILERRPEFAEFIELLGLIRVPLRVTPLQSDRALVIE